MSSFIRRAIRGRSFFKIAQGYFGLCPEPAKVGDSVAVILGCDYPMLLRSAKLLERTCFRIVGPCYVPGIMHIEALLGPLPSGWSVRREKIEAYHPTVFTDGNIRTQQDPRMPLPSAWRYAYGDWKTIQHREAKKLEDMSQQWFENVETGKKTWRDPRLTPELLKARGVAIEEIILV